MNYTGKKTDMCIYWKKSEELMPGLYYVDIFFNGNDRYLPLYEGKLTSIFDHRAGT